MSNVCDSFRLAVFSQMFMHLNVCKKCSENCEILKFTTLNKTQLILFFQKHAALTYCD